MALGLLLARRGIHPTIYELRGKPTQDQLAKPSGMLDLHEESGLRVMRESGLWDKFQARLGDCSEAARVLAPDYTLLYADEGGIESRPEIARNALTDLLVQHVPADSIKWNHKIKSARRDVNSSTGTPEITLDLGPHGTATYDFVIGADGAWSKVRQLLTDVVPFYSGSHVITATLRNASTRFPHLLEVAGTGVMQALGGCKGIMTHRGPQDSIRVYIAIRSDSSDLAQELGVTGQTAAEIKSRLLANDLFGKWADPLKDLLATACDEETLDNPGVPADIMPLYMLPVGHRWDHQSGVTLAGDAAHLMTPWAGEGVNLALWDSLDLAHALSNVPEATDASAWHAQIDPLIRDYEHSMFARSREKAEMTAANKDLFMSEDGGHQLAAFLKSGAEAA